MKPCKLHHLSVDKDGYGRIKHEGRNAMLAHRVAYVVHRGLKLDDIKGQIVRHTCDNPACVEPEHLLLGTVQDNVADRVSRGRGRQGIPRKLTDDQVRYSRQALLLGASYARVGAYLKVTPQVIRQIKLGLTYKDVS